MREIDFAHHYNWLELLDQWISSGRLESAIDLIFPQDDKNPSRLIQIKGELLERDYSKLPTLKVVKPSVTGWIGAYSGETNEIYITEAAALSPEIFGLILAHELGHWIDFQIYGKHNTHNAVENFAYFLTGKARPMRNNSSTEATVHEQESGGSKEIIVDDDKSVSVAFFQTSIHTENLINSVRGLNVNTINILELAEEQSDAFSASVEIKVPTFHGEVGISPYGLQTHSASHFDNSNISGALNVIYNRYVDAVDRLFDTDIEASRTDDLVDSHNDETGLVNPAFYGPDAGVQLLLYRFGQIAHTFEDFYSHSNWVELGKAGIIKENQLIDSSLGLPTIIKAGQAVPNTTNVIVAQNDADWSKTLKRSGKGFYLELGSEDVYWEVDQKTKVLSARRHDGSTVYGLATGATSGLIYDALDKSVLMRDPTKTGFFQEEYFRGFDHGGFAGTLIGQWVGPINKDDAKTNKINHEKARKLASKQIEHEWKRLNSLVFKKHGTEGLLKLANYALTDKNAIKAHVESYSTIVAGGTGETVDSEYEILWSKGIGRNLEGSFGIGDILGIPNENTYKAFIGLTTNKDKQQYNDFLGTTFDGIKEKIGFDTGKLGPDILNLRANVAASLASANDRSDPATLKAGLELGAGYSLGKASWDLPLSATIELGIANDNLGLNINSDIDKSYVDFSLPYFNTYLKAIANLDASIYLDGAFGVNSKGPKLFGKNLWNKGASFDFNERLNLSTSAEHIFVDLDTRKSEQVIDWVSGRKVFKTSSLGDNGAQQVKLSKLFDVGFELPNFNLQRPRRIESSATAGKLLSVPKLLLNGSGEIDFTDSIIYSYKGEEDLLNFKFDVDAFINEFIPPPYNTTYKSTNSTTILGEEFGYDINLALLNLDLTANMALGYQVDLGIARLRPRFQIEAANSYTDFSLDTFNFEVRTESQRLESFNRLKRYDQLGNNNETIDLRAVIDPEFFANASLYLQPKAFLEAGIGQYKLAITSPVLSKTIGGDNKYLVDLGKKSLINGRQINLINKQISKKLSELIDTSSLASIPISLPLSAIAKALGINYVVGTKNSDFFAGTPGSDVADLKEGSDVFQLSTGRDFLYGGSDDSTISDVIYTDIIGSHLAQYKPQSKDIFLIGSNIITPSSSANLALFADPYQLSVAPDFDPVPTYLATVYSRDGQNNTTLKDIERIIISQDLQNSINGIKLDLRHLNYIDYPLYIGGVNPNSYTPAAGLPTGFLTGSNGPDELLVPIGHNKTSPYILGKGDDKIYIGYTPPSNTLVYLYDANGNRIADQPLHFSNANWNGDIFWTNPWADYSDTFEPSNRIKSIVVHNTKEHASSLSFRDIIDLGSGNNSVFFGGEGFDELGSRHYTASVYSVNLGGMNIFEGRTKDLLMIYNLGGSIDLNSLSLSRGSRLHAIISSGSNLLAPTISGFNQNDNFGMRDSDVTILLDTLSLSSKLSLPSVSDLNVIVNDGTIEYSSEGSSVKDVISFQGEYSYQLLLARADIESTDIFTGIEPLTAGINSQQRYALESPLRQTFHIKSNNVKRELTIRGRRQDQINAYTKVVVDPSVSNPIRLGLSRDELFDELVIGDGNNPDQLYTPIGPRFGTVRFNTSKNIDIVAEPGTYSNSNFGPYAYKTILTAFSDRLISDDRFADHTFKWAANENQAQSIDFLDNLENLHNVKTSHAFLKNISPYQTLILGKGDDIYVSNSKIYEFIYPGGGNNIVISPETEGSLIAAEASNGSTISLGNTDRITDTVVYTQGSSQDYRISRYKNSIKVVKPDRKVDYLFGVGNIVFETTDLETILVPLSETNKMDGDGIKDVFGNNVDARYSISTTVDEFGDRHRHIISDDFARHRVDLTSDIIYQAGHALQNISLYVRPGSTSIRLTKKDLLSGYSDPDINAKKLYSKEDLKIRDLVIESRFGTATLRSNGDWLVKLKDTTLSSKSPSISLSYVIEEPEGYKHFTTLSLRRGIPDSVALKGALKDSDIRLSDLTSTKTGIQLSSVKAGQTQVWTADKKGRLVAAKILGTNKSESILGSPVSDNISGLLGNDKILGDLGNDLLNGGPGRDTAVFSSRANRVDLNTTKRQNTGDGRDQLISIENVDAGAGNDIITGNKAANTLNGQSGNDRIFGGDGNDLLIAGSGKDRVWGQAGRDTFRIFKGAGYTIIEDFTDKQDRIHLGSGRSGLQMIDRDDDVYVYLRKDLMAIVHDAVGMLQIAGNYLV